jgi:NitT/TauT family transport system ATP-binding protein
MSAAIPKMEIRGVSKTFHARGGTVAALEPCDLAVASGEFVTVVGPSGCGKSTLMMIAAGLEAPSTGEILVDGLPAGPAGPRRTVVFQRFALFPSETGRREHRLRPARRQGRARGDRAARRRAARADGAWRAFATPIRTSSRAACSSASRSRARSPCRPDILLMDEPFGALDAQTRTVLQEEVSAPAAGASLHGALHHPQRRGGGLPQRPRRRDVEGAGSDQARDRRPARCRRGADSRSKRPATHASFMQTKREIWELIRAEIVRQLAPRRKTSFTRKETSHEDRQKNARRHRRVRRLAAAPAILAPRSRRPPRRCRWC